MISSLPRDAVNVPDIGAKVSNLANTGSVNIHKKRWHNPLSTFPDCSIIVRATDGWVNPPIVNAVYSMAKLASPETKESIA